MTVSVARGFVVAAAILGGLLAGMALDRSLVQLPAWQQLGAVAWSNFTRTADLGRGLFFYPAEGLAALLCSVVAAVLVALNLASLRAAAIPVLGAALLAIAALVVTRFHVAPPVLALRDSSLGPDAMRHSLAAVKSWWALKAGLHLLTFLANIWSLVVLSAQR